MTRVNRKDAVTGVFCFSGQPEEPYVCQYMQEPAYERKDYFRQVNKEKM